MHIKHCTTAPRTSIRLRGIRFQASAGSRLVATTVWPSGLRRWLQAPVRKGVGSNPTAVILLRLYAALPLPVHVNAKDERERQNHFRVRELNPGHLRDRQIY